MEITDNLPKISVICIIYKVEQFLHQAIESILRQTYSNLEIIFVVSENKEGDLEHKTGDLDICRKYAEQDPRIKLVIVPAKGAGDARNQGLDNVTGEYISFVDGDDWIEPDMIEKLYVNIRDQGVKMSVCGKFYEYDDRTDADEIRPLCVMNTEEAFEMILRGTGFFFHCWDKLFEASVFEGLRFPTDKYLEDRYAIYKAMQRAGNIVYESIPLYHYRIRKDSCSRVKEMTEYNTDADAEFCEHIRKLYPRLNDLAEAFLLYDHITCIQNYLLNIKGQPEDTEKMQNHYAEHRTYVKNIGDRINDNPEISRTLKIKRLLAVYSPGLLAFITKRHIKQIANDIKYQ